MIKYRVYNKTYENLYTYPIKSRENTAAVDLFRNSKLTDFTVPYSDGRTYISDDFSSSHKHFIVRIRHSHETSTKKFKKTYVIILLVPIWLKTIKLFVYVSKIKS